MRTLLPIIFILNTLTFFGQDNRNEFEELAAGYYNQGRFAQAAEFYCKSGYSYWNNGNRIKAVEVFQKAYEIFNNEGRDNAAIGVSNNQGLIYLEDNKYSNASIAFNNALKHARKIKNINEILNSLINLGSVEIELSSYPEAIAKSSEALEIAREMNNLKAMAKCYSLLAESFEKSGDGTNAFKYYELFSSIDKKIKKSEIEDVKNTSQEEINKAHEKKRITEIELKINKGQLKLTQDSLGIAERTARERQMQLVLRNSQLREKEVQLRYEKHLRTTLVLWIIFITFFLAILGYLLRQKLLDNKTLKKQKEEITQQRNRLDLQNKKITDSIQYGLRIQQAMLPELSKLGNGFETFIIYRPKDIVSGDFYWYYETIENSNVYRFIAVSDCTGHGVPGAFMSMIGHRLLAEIVIERKRFEPSEILMEINDHLRNDLNKESKKTNDGMDIALCRISESDSKETEVVFAGAKREIYHYKTNIANLEIYDGDHLTLGGIAPGDNKKITNKSFKMRKGDFLFLFSDGIIDQPNHERKRFGTHRFVNSISLNINCMMAEMKVQIEKDFDDFKGAEEQRDDITVLSITKK